jgi:hypothetical protein
MAYTPIDEAKGQVTAARPVFYGMLLVSLAGTGDLFQTTVKAGLNATAFTVAQPDGVNIIVINKDPTSGLDATVDVGGPAVAASAIYLTGPSLTAKTGLTISGAEITPTGTWSKTPSFRLSPSANTVKVLVPAASAALVHVL